MSSTNDDATVEDQDDYSLDKLMAYIAARWPEWEKHGIGPDAESVRNAAAVGMVELVWRNSPLENMHAGGGRRGLGPSDGEMFAESVALQRVAYAALEPYQFRYGLGSDPHDAPLRVSEPTLDYVRLRSFEDHILDTRRPWAAGGRTLAEMGWGYIGEFRKHVKLRIRQLMLLDDEYGYRAVLGLLIGPVVFAGDDDHYGMPRWPAKAAAVREILLDPGHIGWWSYSRAADPAPPGTPEPDELYQALLDGPDKLPIATLSWLANEIMFAATEAEREARRPAPGCSCSWCLQRQKRDEHIAVLDQ
jgi:hypothetical protein